MIHSIPATVTVRLDAHTQALEAVLEAHKDKLDPIAEELFTLLFQTAVYALEAKGQTLKVSQTVIHQPVEILCAALGITRPTFYKYLHALEALGLVHSRAHKGQWFGLVRNTGTLFAVALKPLTRARIRFYDLKHQWRDLQADTQRTGRTAWSFLQSHLHDKTACTTALKEWAVNPGTTQKPVNNDCKGNLRETVYSLSILSETHFRDRPKLIDTLAQALARGFIDSHNLNFWRKLLWDALNKDLTHGTLYQLQNALTRLMADVQEWQGLKSPGSLLVHRLKQCGLWDALRYS